MVAALDRAAASAGESAAGADPDPGAPAAAPVYTGDPYPGLAAFTPEQAPIFFGRGGESDQLLQLLADPRTRFAALVGASGAGKSSLVAAGLIPRLRAGLIGGAPWVDCRFTPAERGRDPFLALAMALKPRLPGEQRTAEALARDLRTDPPGRPAMAAMIQGPARAVGLDLEQGLCEQILEDAGGAGFRSGAGPGTLALTAFALAELYELGGAGGRLTLAHYQAIGGIAGAVRRRAETALGPALGPRGQAQDAALGGLFEHLVEVDEQETAARRRAALAEVPAAARPLAEALTHARLLTAGRGADEAPTLELAHETLLRAWPDLARWVSGHAEALRARRDLERAAREWADAGRPGSALRTGAVLILHEPDMVEIAGGRFRMGEEGGESYDAERPVHERTIAPFAIGRTEVSFDDYDLFAAATGRAFLSDQGWGRGRRPVINVSWEDARDYAAWLARVTGRPYRLPSEAEWEYAARAGTTAPRWYEETVGPDANPCRFMNGQDQSFDASSSYSEATKKALAAQDLWKPLDCDDRYANTAPVGSFEPNPWGLYDMLGNVWEWVADCPYGYSEAPVDGRAVEGDGENESKKCAARVLRGGSWYVHARLLRAAVRSRNAPGNRSYDLGLRLARSF